MKINDNDKSSSIYFLEIKPLLPPNDITLLIQTTQESYSSTNDTYSKESFILIPRLLKSILIGRRSPFNWEDIVLKVLGDHVSSMIKDDAD